MWPGETPGPNIPKLCLSGKEAPFTISPLEAQTMTKLGGMMRSINVVSVSNQLLDENGFDGWWNQVENLIGCIDCGGGDITFIAKTQPWDGAKDGCFNSIIRFTDPPNKKRVRDFFSTSQPLPPVLGECISVSALQPTKPPVRCATQNVVLLSRYRDNIYICILNAPTRLLPGLKVVLSQLLSATYGIKLKWDPHGDSVVWGEGSLTFSEKGLSLTRKGISPSLGYTNPEWHRWVDASSPHARLAWRSQFPSLLHKCVWYALSISDVLTNLRSLLWGVGQKGYPKSWWQGCLTRFFAKVKLQRVSTMGQLRDWVREGKQSR